MENMRVFLENNGDVELVLNMFLVENNAIALIVGILATLVIDLITLFIWRPILSIIIMIENIFAK